MYTSKIGSDSFHLAVERFVSSLSQYLPKSNISCDKCTNFDQFNRDCYKVNIKVKPRKSQTYTLIIRDESCTSDVYDRGCNVYLVDEYGNIDRSWGLMLDCPGYTGNHVARCIQDNN